MADAPASPATKLEYEEVLTCIRRSNAETGKFIAEARKLGRDTSAVPFTVLFSGPIPSPLDRSGDGIGQPARRLSEAQSAIPKGSAGSGMTAGAAVFGAGTAFAKPLSP